MLDYVENQAEADAMNEASEAHEDQARHDRLRAMAERAKG